MLTKVFVFGLDNAGKTALTAYLKTGKSPDSTTPTQTFNIENLIIQELEFVLWDAPGQQKYRSRWSRGLGATNILLFVLDTADDERYEEALAVLKWILSMEENRGSPLIFCFHKMDLEEARANYNRAREIFKIPLISERKVYSIRSSIITGEGIEDIKKALVECAEKLRWG